MSSPRARPTITPPGMPLAHRSGHQVASRFVLAACRLSEALHLDDRGATAIEYGLLAGLIAAVIAGAVGLVGAKVLAMFTSLANAF